MKLEWLDQNLVEGTITVGIVDLNGKVVMQETFPDYYPKSKVDAWADKKITLLELLMERGSDDIQAKIAQGISGTTT